MLEHPYFILERDPNAGTLSSRNIAYVRTLIVGTLADVGTSLLGTITDVGTSLGENQIKYKYFSHFMYYCNFKYFSHFK